MNKNLPQLNDNLQTTILYLPTVQVRSKIIYIVVLLAVSMTLAALPLISIEVSVNSTGIFQSSEQRSVLNIPVNGRIISTVLLENKKVKAGDTLVSIDASLNGKQSSLTNKRIAELKLLLRDINIMVSKISDTTALTKVGKSLSSTSCLASWEQFTIQTIGANIKLQQAIREFRRYDILHSQKVITESEFEKFKVGLEQAKTDCQFVNKQNVLSWQSDAQRYRGELNDLNEKAVGWQEQQKYYTLISPINGSLQNISTINKGEVVFANEKVAEISPDSTLIAVCFLSPSDIGFVHMGQTVHFQIGAYDYNRWGLVNGKVVEISDDVILDVNRQPLFKIKCKLDRPYILLNGRIRGNIKKGMTFNARFRVSDKTIFQLLYDQTDNWINPNTKS